jgi:hypothetical protein
VERRDFVLGVTAFGASLIRPPRRGGPTSFAADLLIALEPPSPGMSVYEPHVAIDPGKPDRIAVAAQYGIRGGRGGRNIQLWTSENGGRKWFATRVPRPRLDGEFAADALVGFHADGGLLVTSDFGGKWVADANDARSWSRRSAPSVEQMLAFGGKDGPPPDALTSGGIAVSRTADGGRTLAATVVPGKSVAADKTAMAFDRFEGSPHRGAVYVAWSDMIPSIHVARSTDGGRTFAEPAVLETGALAAMHQIAVRPDGSVHSMWTSGGMPGLTQMPGGADNRPPGGGKSIYHAVSTDGGATFSEPTVAGSHAGPGMVGIPSLAVDARGVMLWVWSQADALPDPTARPILQARHRLYAIRSEDGRTWSAPFELCPWAPADTHMGLPAVTSDGRRWWLLGYLADGKETRVALLRSDDGRRFELDRILAKRRFPADEISLMGSYLARFADDISQVGDYVGVAASGSRVASAFVLPETNSPASRATVYFALSEVR